MSKFLRRSLSRSRGSASVVDFTVNRFLGLVTNVADPKEVQKGVAIDNLNWLTGAFNDHIELRPGMKLLGLQRLTELGKISGMGVGIQNDGTQRLFWSHGRKVKYYDHVTDLPVEVGSNLLPASADGEDVSFEYYNGIAGAFEYLSSPNSSIYKIPIANPASAIDLQSATYKGKIKIKQGRTFLWDNKVTSTGFTDKTGLSLSYIDKALFTDFTSVSAEAFGTGDGTTKTFNHTASAVTSKRSGFGFVVTDGVETFLDNKNGVMIGSAGGTGTVNYATGAVSVTFNTAPILSAAITVNYQWEDATSTGIADFTFSSTRTAGQGNYFRQDDGGGNLMTVMSFNTKEYCLHLLKTWLLEIGADDTDATNLIYRNRVGIPYWLAACETGDGIVYLDYTDKNNPEIKRLQIGSSEYPASTEVLPNPLSVALNLSPYEFDYALVQEWGNYYLLSCQEKVLGTANNYNGVTFVYHKTAKAWDKLNYFVSRFAILDGKLYGGDSISNNVFELFSGADEDGNIIDNFWTSGQMNLGAEGRKRFYRFLIDGYINQAQDFDIFISYDNGAFTKVGNINGTAGYVDSSLGTMVGNTTVGTDVVGSSGGSNAYHFRNEFVVASDVFEYAQVKFVANEVGALQINSFTFRDIRYKGRKSMPVYVTQ
jgi:hypothetical protein